MTENSGRLSQQPDGRTSFETLGEYVIAQVDEDRTDVDSYSLHMLECALRAGYPVIPGNGFYGDAPYGDEPYGAGGSLQEYKDGECDHILISAHEWDKWDTQYLKDTNNWI
jgi:hypothetical protein